MTACGKFTVAVDGGPTSDAFSAEVRRRLERIVEQTVILSPRLFRLGSGMTEMVTTGPTAYPNESLADALTQSLTQALYLTYYCGLEQSLQARHDLLPELQRANSSAEGWDDGWSLVREEADGRALVRSGARTRPVHKSELRAFGTDYSIRRRREDLELQPGYYYSFGETLADHYDEHVTTRIYLNLTARSAARWLGAVTRLLNHYSVPFQFKVLRHAESYARIDSGILYVPRRYGALTASLLLPLSRALGGLGARTPLFTRRLGPGIALADGPPGGESFGLARMRLLARALVECHHDQRGSGRQRLRAVAEHFRQAGIECARPWLSPGNTELALPRLPARTRARTRTVASTPWLDVADRIGARLIRDAIWHGNQCTWTGWTQAGGTEPTRRALSVLEGDLYSGTAGVALFLAHLSRATREPRQREAALGALRHAVAQTRRGHWTIGAYSGLAGVLRSVVEVARACRSQEAMSMAAPLLHRLERARPTSAELDILAGRAGAVRALLWVAQHCRHLAAPARGLALRFSEQILTLARVRDSQWSWRTLDSGAAEHLLGYSHGTAGIACALDDLAASGGEPRFAQAAAGAWRYELARFDSGAGNWPDYRQSQVGGASRSDQLLAWCHGAPGTALALARTVARGRHDASLRAALAAARQSLMAALQPQSIAAKASFCLCHGIAGNADVLWQIDGLAGRKRPASIVLEAAQIGRQQYHQTGQWPCGLPQGGETPSLMLGLAGIGHFYLRLHDAAVPSALLL